MYSDAAGTPMARRRAAWSGWTASVAWVTVVVTTAALFVQAPTGASAVSTVPAVAAPDWETCANVPEPTLGLQCASIDVPLDYRSPAGATISVAISRLRAVDPAKRRGVLLLNPGGQFTSELSMPLRLVSQGLPVSVRERYDLIGFDPRGIGASTPVSCDLRTDQMFTIPPSPYADDATEVAAQAARMRAIAGQCGSSRTAGLLPHMTPANVARDLDSIRQALGESRISYLGYSFGTYLGAVYSTLFPGRTDRVVLDSVVGPTGMDYTWSRRLGLGVEQRFPDFARWAAGNKATYRLGATPKQVRATLFRLAEALNREPVEGIDGDLFRYLTFSQLFADAAFPTLGRTWRALLNGATGRPIDPADALLLQQMSNTAFDFSGLLHLDCSNASGWPRDVRTYQRNVAVDRARYPIFGGASANIWPCAFWPATSTARPVRIGDAGPSNILMVSNERDPGTPLEGALQMRRALGDRARLVTVDHGGHLVYLNEGNACADAIVTAFLVDGVRPVTDAFCSR